MFSLNCESGNSASFALTHCALSKTIFCSTVAESIGLVKSCVIIIFLLIYWGFIVAYQISLYLNILSNVVVSQTLCLMQDEPIHFEHFVLSHHDQIISIIMRHLRLPH